MKGGLALDALGDVDGELDTVVAKGIGRSSSVDRSATVTAQNTAGFISIYFLGYILRRTYVAFVLLTAWLPEKAPAIDTGASRSMDAIVKSVDDIWVVVVLLIVLRTEVAIKSYRSRICPAINRR